MWIKLTNDISELWIDFKAMVTNTYTLWTTPKYAPPSIRTVALGFMTLKDESGNSVGCFVPELYELAQINGLKCQLEETTWKKKRPKGTGRMLKKQPFYAHLYHRDGSRKSAFELAVLPVEYSDNDKSSARAIQKRVEDEFNYRIDKGLALPAIVFKYQIKSDYLKNISQIGLVAGSPRGIKLNLLNPEDKTSKMEWAMHYIAQRAALAVTAVGVIAVLGWSHTAPPIWVAAMMIGTLLAEWCSKEFATYETAEALLREMGVMSDKSLFWGNKISVKKTLKTIVLLAAVCAAAVSVAINGWVSVMALPWPKVGIAGFSHALIGAQYALAGLVVGVGTLGSWLGGMAAQRSFWGIGIWDKQIDFSKEKGIVAPNRKQIVECKLDKWKMEFIAKLGINQKDHSKVYLQVMKNFTHLKDLAHKNVAILAQNDYLQQRYPLRNRRRA